MTNGSSTPPKTPTVAAMAGTLSGRTHLTGSLTLKSMHIPNLDAIKSLPDADLRFYALGGAIMSLAAAIELKYFDLFVKATKTERDKSARYFYLIISASMRRQMANAAIQGALTGPLLDEWKTLLGILERLTGMHGHRNLLAHAVVYKIVSPGPVASSGFLGLTETNYVIEQDAAVLLANPKASKAQDFDALFAYCQELIDALNTLDTFLQKLP